jgi:hypothetical protein
MSNFDQACERYWPDTRIAPGYNQCASSCQPGSGEGAANGLPASRAKGAQMKEFTLACLLLSLCVSSSAAGAAPQSNRQTSGEDKCSAGFRECQESLNDFKEAEHFMQLKATVLADLNRLEKSRPTKPKIATVRDANVNRQKTGIGAHYSATVGRNGKPSVQATSAIQPVSLEP